MQALTLKMTPFLITSTLNVDSFLYKSSASLYAFLQALLHALGIPLCTYIPRGQTIYFPHSLGGILFDVLHMSVVL